MELWSEEAEVAVLGALMTHARAKSEAADAGLRATDFYKLTHAQIFSLIDEHEEILSPLILIDLLDNSLSLSADPKMAKAIIMSMPQHACLIAQVKRTSEIIMKHAALRRLAQAGSRIAQIVQADSEIGEKLTEAEDVITEVVQESAGGQMQPLGSAMLPALKVIGQNSREGLGVSWISTGFTKLDDTLVGLRPGKLIVVAARPGCGKSTLAVNIIEHVAKKGTPAALFSLEMGSDEIGKKLLASMADVSYERLVDLRTPLPAADLAKIQAAYKKLRDMPIFVSDEGSPSMSDIRARARSLVRTEGLGLLVVDYLQLMVGGQADNRNNEVGIITRAMKLLARELKIPVILVSQLSRASEKRQDKSPMLSDLRDSGNIEQDADQVVFIHRPELYEGPNSEKAGLAELSIAKNRDGKLGFVNLTFVGHRSKFLEVASYSPITETDLQPFGVQ